MLARYARLALGTLALFAAVPALAQDANWVEVTESANGSQKEAVDTTTLIRKGDVVTYWNRTEYVNHAKGWKKALAEIEVNCKTRMERPLTVTLFFTDGRSFDIPGDGEWNKVESGTISADLTDFVCNR